MNTLLNQFNSQLEKNTVSSISSHAIADINTILQMSAVLDEKTHSDFHQRVTLDISNLVTKYKKEFADYVTEQDSQKVSDSKTK